MKFDEASVIHARYASWRPAQGRGMLQIICEVPLEKQGEVLERLGAPIPSRDISVAIAVIDAPGEELGLKPVPKVETAGDRAVKRSALLSQEKRFMDYLGVGTVQEAADQIRRHCKIASRKELATNADALERFRELVAAFETQMVVDANWD